MFQHHSMKRSVLAAAVAAATLSTTLASTPAQAAAAAFDNMVVLGDSLSDIGNVDVISGGMAPPSPSYYAGRFSNGPNWVDQLADRVGAGALRSSLVPGSSDSVVYAHGGSGSTESSSIPGGGPVVSGLLGQVDDFVAEYGAAVDPDTLYVVWGGANDYLLASVVPEFVNPPVPTATVDNVATTLATLGAVGAESILVGNLPDVGSTPLAGLLGDPETLSAHAATHNHLLLLALANLRPAVPDVDFYLFDAYEVLEVVKARGNALGFGGASPGPASGCLFPPFVCTATADAGYAGSVFWDELHPTTEAHNVLASVAARTLNAGPTIFAETDIRPNSAANNVFRFGALGVRVAITTTSTADGEPVDFDAQTLNPATIRFGAGLAPATKLHRITDVDGDGDLDLVVRMRPRNAAIECGDTAIAFKAMTYAGVTVIGRDDINVLGCP